MIKVIVTIILVVILAVPFMGTVLAASSISRTQTITQEIVDIAKPEPDPNRFEVFVRLGYDRTWYFPNNTLRGSIEAAGEYNDSQYMLEVPKGCVVTGTPERINWLWLDSIVGDVLTFVGGDASFSKPCTLYIAEGGRLSQDYWTGDWLGDGEWVEVGSFTSIVDGEARLD